MGTTYNVKVVEMRDISDDALLALDAEIASALSEVDVSLSTYKPDSELMRFNSAEVGSTFSLSETAFAVFSLSEQIMHDSGGYFDPSVGPLVSSWGFGARASQVTTPDDETVRSLLAQTGMRNVKVNNDSSVTKIGPTFIDFSAIAKGYAVDKAAEMLVSKGFKDFLVEVGGEVRVSGVNDRGTKWRLGIEQPDFALRKAYNVAHISDVAMATSGDYRNFIEVDGGKRSHTIDPKTGYPVFSDLASVSVVTDDCASADAWATAFLAMGKKRAIELSESKGLPVYLIYRVSDGFESYISAEMQQYLH